MSRRKNFTKIGDKFGMLTVASDLYRVDNRTLVRVNCDCGVCDKEIREDLLYSNAEVKSCGCYKIKHNMSLTRPYWIWYDVKRRCSDNFRIGYENYGGRGISYEKSWETFEGFWDDMKYGYSDNLTLERIDVNLNYSKDNCEWIERSEQALNKRGYKNNKLGIPNMSLDKNGRIKVRIQDPESGKRIVKRFPVDENSFEFVLEEAQLWLDQKRVEFGYKGTHGS